MTGEHLADSPNDFEILTCLDDQGPHRRTWGTDLLVGLGGLVGGFVERDAQEPEAVGRTPPDRSRVLPYPCL